MKKAIRANRIKSKIVFISIYSLSLLFTSYISNLNIIYFK